MPRILFMPSGRIVVTCMALFLILIGPACGQDADEQRGATRLKQIALTWHLFHGQHESFPPPAIHDDEGKPLLSWRVLILPFLEGGEALFSQFDLDQPWDSPHNIKLLDQMPEVFAGSADQAEKPYSTSVVGIRGKGYVFDGERGTRMRQILDGTSNTVAFVETRTDIPWTKPEDLSAGDEVTPEALSNLRPGGFFVALTDGSVHFFPEELAAAELVKFLTIAGREPVELPGR